MLFNKIQWNILTEDSTISNCNCLKAEDGNLFIINKIPENWDVNGNPIWEAIECDEFGFITKAGRKFIIKLADDSYTLFVSIKNR